jgi:hypothetical protein
MLVRSSIRGNAGRAKSRCPSQVKKRYVTALAGRCGVCCSPCKRRAMHVLLSKKAQIANVAGQRHLASAMTIARTLQAPLSGDRCMSHITLLVDGLFGLAAISSFAGCVFHLLTGNPDMALLCFVGVGGCAAIGWIFTSWQRA